MAIDAATLTQYIALSAGSGATRQSDVSGDGMFASMLAQTIAGDTLTASAQESSASSQSFSAENMLLMLLMMSSSGTGGNGMFGSQSLSLLATSLGGALFGGGTGSSVSVTSTTSTTSAQAYDLSKMATSGIAGLASAVPTAESEAITPVSASKAVTPAVVSTVGNRSAALYREVIDQFNVETNARYAVNKKGKNDTYCNIFLWDVTRAMGAEIPHYVDPETLEPRYYPDIEGAKEMNANAIYDWLATVGEKYGWYRVTEEQAQNLANQGLPAVTIRKNAGGHGHAQVVSPSVDGQYDAQRGTAVAQAGLRLRNYAYLSQLFSDTSDVAFYAHI